MPKDVKKKKIFQLLFPFWVFIMATMPSLSLNLAWFYDNDSFSSLDLCDIEALDLPDNAKEIQTI